MKYGFIFGIAVCVIVIALNIWDMIREMAWVYKLRRDGARWSEINQRLKDRRY